MFKPLLFMFISILSNQFLFAQSFPDKLKQALDSFDYNYPQEKLFVHTDRSNYATEETIWFKTYITLDGQPSILSKIVYVEVVNQKNEVIEKRMLPLTNGTASGEIFLKKDLPAGTYSLNAYTSWMLNFPEYIFKKPITIFNSDLKTTNTTNKKNDFHIQFFPEGGDLINGLNTKIAFKAVGINGLPLEVAGDIVNEKNENIAAIKTMHDGMGYFEMKPNKTEKYNAVFVVNGIKKTFSLPPVKDEGVTLQVNNSSANNFFFQLQRSEENSSVYNKLTLTGRMNNTLVYAAEMNFDEGLSAGAINKKNLPAGIIQLTVFNSSGLPLAERLVFISNYTLPQVQFSTDSLSTAKRKKNLYTIDLSEFKNISASASVTNLSADSSIHDDNLLSSLLLTSELRGYIKDAAYYFKDKSAETLQHLDLLMMTHGWRRFNLQDIMALNFPSIKYPIESEIAIKGKLSKLNGKALPGGRIDFITKTEDSSTILSTITLNAENEFVLAGLNFKKTATIFYKGSNSKNENAFVDIEIAPSYFDTLKKSNNYFIQMNNDLQALNFTTYYNKIVEEKKIADEAEGKLLAGVTVHSKKISFIDSLNDQYVSGAYMNSDMSFPYNGKNAVNIWNYLRANISGLEIGKDEFGETTVMFTRQAFANSEISEFNNLDPTTNIGFYLNEVKVSKEQIETLNPEDIVLVKVWKGTSANTIGTDLGAIAFYTDKTKPNIFEKGFSAFKKEGYSVTREFYAVNYDLLNPHTSFIDERPTLYWNPDIKPGKDGKAVIKFFNDDQAKKFKLIIQGIDENGRIISIQKIIE